MRSGPVRSFWLSFLLTLAVVMPVMGGFALYVAAFPQTARTEQIQSGVPVNRPTGKNDLSLLAVSAAEEPAFLLVRLNASQARFQIYVLPAQTVVLSAEGPCTLAQAYASAGPARAAGLRSDTLQIPLEQYLAATPEVWAQAAEETGTARLNLDGLLNEEERAALGLTEGVLTLNGEGAARLLEEAELEPVRLAGLRAGIWQAFARQNRENLGSAVGGVLRQNSGSLLTNLSGVDLYTLEDTLGYLAQAEPEAQLLPGDWEGRTGRYSLNEEALNLAQEEFSQLTQEKEVDSGQAQEADLSQ